MRVAVSCSGGMNRQLEVAQRLARDGRLAQLLVPYYSSKHPLLQRLTGRRHDPQSVPDDLVTTDVWAAGVRKVLSGTPLRSVDAIDDVLLWREAVDRGAARHLRQGADVLFCESMISLDTMRRARDMGMLRALDRTNAHVAAQQEFYSGERELLGLTSEPYVSDAFVERAEAEYAEADLIVCLSSFVRDTFLERGLPADKLVVVPSGVDLSAFTPGASPPPAFRVLYVGLCSVKKGTHHLLEAFRRLDVPGAELWIVGAVADEIRPWVDRAPEGVRFLGFVPHSDLPGIMGSCSVFAHPSLEEGLAKVLMEAMASGLPVVATPNTGAASVMTDGEEGFIVPVRDPGAMAGRLRELAADPGLLARMSAAARDRVSAGLSWDDYAERLYAALDAALARKGA